jgi:hypothetical protein
MFFTGSVKNLLGVLIPLAGNLKEHMQKLVSGYNCSSRTSAQ